LTAGFLDFTAFALVVLRALDLTEVRLVAAILKFLKVK
jgi:hypothetical protein